MTIDYFILYVLLVIFLATLIRSIFGFGESLVAVPLLAFRIPLEVAVPLSVLVSITVASVVVVQDRQQIHFRSAGWLVLFTILGIPLGLMLLTAGDEQIVKAVLGFITIAFSLYSLYGKAPIELKTDSKGWLFGCGFIAGILGGAYGLNGPPLVVYGAMRRWSAQHFRATLQGYYLPASMLGMLGYWIKGLWTTQLTYYFLWSLPVMIPAIFIGRTINRRMHGETFFKYVYFGLIAIGALLLYQSIFK
ncbi:sulfite exporter TauE/SafE family protein [Pontibacter harenae]|uniref:sulfite exporter TauE/SafE family protein n=1 Tax=Pontibacter harenae TaxID=2894083 RepID=UPI001E33BB53|nr:sulfite exporter TauE/SafE family protein [Pontibacter harenae]MCC9167723.1 sulfite exporter TauE/SafE family protein [Pontibacter harenae]